jgi:succinoglycan biosynthesis transport protein ExoP
VRNYTTRDLTVLDYINIFWRRKWLVIIPVVIAAVLSIAACFLIKPQYQAFTLVLVQMVRPGAGVEGGRYEAYQQNALYSEIETISKLFTSKMFIEMLAEELKIDLPKYDPGTAEKRLQELRQALAIEPIESRGILKITARGSDPIFCAKLVNTATESFIKYYRQIGFDRSSAELEFLNEQKELYRQKIEDTEKRMREFKEGNREVLAMSVDRKLLGSLPPGMMVAGGSFTKFADYKDTLFELNLALEDAQKNKEDLKQQLAKSLEDSSILGDDPAIQEMLKSIADKSIELSRIRASGLTDEHPAVDKLRREIKGVEAMIKERSDSIMAAKDKKSFSSRYQQLSRDLIKAEADLEALKKRIKGFEEMSKRQDEILASVPEKEEMLGKLQSEYELNSKLFAEFTLKLETAVINQRLEQQEKGVRFKLIETAAVPLYPYKPNKRSIVLLGLAFGLMIGMGLVAFREAADISFNSNKELEDLFKIPVLGNVDSVYSLKDAELLRWRYNLIIFSLFAMALAVTFVLVIKLLL